MSESGEDNLIARYFRPLAKTAGALELRDDAAVLAATSGDLVVTTDAIVEGVHYLATDPPDTIARKALRVNLSDLAAKGATPVGFLLTLALREAGESWLSTFAAALGDDADAFGCPLLGGDTVSTPGPVMISIAAFGRVASGRMVKRSTARPGDLVAVTGTIGDATLGLDVLRGGRAAAAVAADASAAAYLVDRYRVPRPRLSLAKAIGNCASAAMDVSDGLAGDFAKLCAASGVSAVIDLPKVPLSDAARAVLAAGATTIEALISGGDDYEIVCTLAEPSWNELAKLAAGAGVPAAIIGAIVEGEAPPVFRDGSGCAVTLSRASFSHF